MATTIVCIQLVLNMVTIAMGITCMTDFSKGLYGILNPSPSSPRDQRDGGNMEGVHSLTSGRILLD
jgi:hypothetical protein